MKKLTLALFIVCVSTPVFAQDQGAANKAWGALKAELNQKNKAYKEALRRGDEKTRARLKDQPSPAIVYEKKFIDFANVHAKTNAARLALIWVAKRGSGTGASETAIKVLLKNHWDDPLIHEVFPGISYHPDANAFYEAILNRSKHKKPRALACYYLAKALANSTDYTVLDDAETKKTIQLLNRAQTEFKDLLGGPRLKMMASCLYKMKKLQIGQVAPEIEGSDVDGQSFKLSDYRGKVVLLIFWGDW